VDEADATRLNRFLAMAGVASRRGADALVAAGRVTIDGAVVTEAGRRVAAGEEVAVDGRAVQAQAFEYLLLHKPRGVVTTARDPQGRQTVLDLVRSRARVYPVGRLDLTTTGLLLLTNDGELAARLMHPRHGVPKTYRALVRGRVTDATLDALRAGVELDDGPARVDAVRKSGGDRGGDVLEIEVHEGRTHLVRRLCETVGHPCRALHRSGYGPLELGDLRPGSARPLTAAEVDALRVAAGLRRAAPPAARRPGRAPRRTR
jgi:23S rRNA pseudouridine2605 synthase